MSSAVLRRVVRRETHSPRTFAAVTVLVLVALAAIYAGVEVVLHLLGLGPLLVAPGAVLSWLTTLPTENPQMSVVAGGAVALTFGFVFVWLSASPGRRPKHEISVSAPAVVVVDNGVIASALAERLRHELDLSKGAVVVGVGNRSADVTIQPEPGQVIDKAEVETLAEEILAHYDLSVPPKAHVRVLRTNDTEGAS